MCLANAAAPSMMPTRSTSPKLTDRVIQIAADVMGDRLDVTVARLCDLSRAQARRLIDEGLVQVNGRAPGKAGAKVETGDLLTVHIPPPEPAEPQPEALPLSIVFEDEHLIVVDKPAGMTVHPG